MAAISQGERAPVPTGPLEVVRSFFQRPTNSDSALTVDQARALIGHAAQHGIKPDLAQKLSDEVNGLADEEPLPGKTLATYGELSKEMTPITGKSLIDSLQVDSHVRWTRRTTYIVLGLVLLNGVLSSLFGDLPEPEDETMLFFYEAQNYFLDFISPFLWGALGSCVFLLKRYSDLAEAKVFDRNCRQGWGSRILLGAILGGVVQYLYDSSIFTDSGLNLDAKALGFVAGLGVKVIYGAIEKTVESLGEVMNLKSLRTTDKPENLVRKFLAEQMATEQDQAKRNVISELIKRV
jgi:hypothetical protein